MEKRVRTYILVVIFILLSLCIIGKNRKIELQEKVEIEVGVKGRAVVQRYIVQFSTEEKRNNFKILSEEKNTGI